MNYWKIRNNRSGGVGGAYGFTFGEACEKLGWKYTDCQVLQVW